jgi:glutamine---fructose-6-phosphate transaminase (isomerizing)
VTATLMAQEIAEQPAAIERTLDALLPARDDLRALAAGRRQVVLAARGTSDHAALYARYLLEVHAGLGAAPAAPSLATHYDVTRDLDDTLVVSLSQSGATDDIVAYQRWARRHGARTVAIANEAGSPLIEEADIGLVTLAGPERAVPATKTYTAQLAAVAVLADALGPADASFEPTLRQVPARVAGCLDTRAGVDDAVAALTDRGHLLVAGRGIVFGTALEVALKLEETCLEPVRGLSYADLRHGPIAVVDGDTTVLVVAAQDGPMVGPLAELAADVARRGAATIAIGGDAHVQAACDRTVAAPALPELLAPLGLVVPAQLVVEGLARARGLDPDAPRGLSKVTSTEPGQATDATAPGSAARSSRTRQ